VVEKCTFCSHRLLRAREKAKAEGRDLLALHCSLACPVLLTGSASLPPLHVEWLP
jgi:hypothetical protein